MLPLTLVVACTISLQESAVISHIGQLGDERFAVRAAAHRDLERILFSDMGHLFRRHVEAAVRHPDLEISRRAVILMEDFYNVRPSRYPVLPWIDMLPTGQADRQTTIDRSLGSARSAGCWGQQSDWGDYRYATYIYAGELLRQGHSRKSVRDILDQMVAQEKAYREKRGMNILASE